MQFLSHNNGRVYLNIYVQPGAKKTAVDGVHHGHLKIRLAAPPTEGKANEALCCFLKEILKISRKDIAIVKGEKSRIKTVAIAGADPETIRGTLLAHIPDFGK
jgi:uncharacterized protein (TIGR00251 family)